MHATSLWRLLLGVSMAAALALLLFSPVLRDFFASDDFCLLAGVHDGGPFGFFSRNSPFLRPLASLSIWLELHLFGLNPVGFHVVNILLHTLATLGLWMVGRELGFARSTASIAALLFLIAPAHAEPVAWISCRMDLLATALGLCGLWAWLVAGRHLQALPLVLALLLLAGALFSKEAAVPLCLVLGAWELRTLRRTAAPASKRAALIRLAIALALVPFYMTVRRLALGQWIGGYGQVHTQFEPRKLGAHGILDTLRILLGHFPPALIGLADHRLILGFLAIVGIALVYFGITRFPAPGQKGQTEPLSFVGFAYALTLLPVINLNIAMEVVSEERYLYLPSAFLFLFAAAFLSRVVTQLRVRLLVACGIAALYIVVLEYTLPPFHEAGTLVASLLPEIAAARQKGSVTLLNIPDNVRGAYVLRNGLNEALYLFYDLRTPTVTLLRHTVFSSQEPVYLQGEAASFRLRPADERSQFCESKSLPGLSIEISQESPHLAELRGQLPSDLYIYSAGHIHPLGLKALSRGP